MNSKTGVLHVVATPIGNLADLSPRAADVLRSVDLVLAEDTRQTGILLRHYDIRTPVIAFHEHNERKQSGALLDRIARGESMALVSDAGTPLISDPGYPLVSEARERGITVSPVPGPCALVAALSASGLPTDRFVFEGFVPPKAGARDSLIAQISREPATVVLYESSHRILNTLDAMAAHLGADRTIVIGREISKRFESFYRGDAATLRAHLEADSDRQRGEFVIMVEGAGPRDPAEDEIRRLLELLQPEMSHGAASRVAAEWFGIPRKRAYALGLARDRNGRSIWE